MTNVAPIALQPHMMAQVAAQQNVSGASPLSTGSTPQSVTPNTSIQAAPPTPPVHHPGSVPNQPPTPTPQQPIMYAGLLHMVVRHQQHFQPILPIQQLILLPIQLYH